MANLNVKFCRYIILPDNIKNSQWKTMSISFHYNFLKMQHLFHNPLNAYFFFLIYRIEGSILNVKIYMLKVIEHISTKIWKIYKNCWTCKVHLFMNYTQFEGRNKPQTSLVLKKQLNSFQLGLQQNKKILLLVFFIQVIWNLDSNVKCRLLLWMAVWTLNLCPSLWYFTHNKYLMA